MSETAPDNVKLLPVWKKGSSLEEWFHEFAMLARQHPKRFGKMVIVYEETLPNGNTVLRTHSHGAMNLCERMGVLQQGALDMYMEALKR
jgi:hypothetical protein